MPHKPLSAITLLLIALTTTACSSGPAARSEGTHSGYSDCLVRPGRSLTVKATSVRWSLRLDAGFPLRAYPRAHPAGKRSVRMPGGSRAHHWTLPKEDEAALDCTPIHKVPLVREEQVRLCRELVGVSYPKPGQPEVMRIPSGRTVESAERGAPPIAGKREPWIQEVGGHERMSTLRRAVVAARC